MYYNNRLRLEQKEYEKIEEEMKEQKKENGGEQTTWQKM